VPKLTEIWKRAWILTDGLSGPALGAQNNLFGSWLQVYVALRQVPKIIAIILQLLKDTDEAKVMWPVRFLEV
jgi:hypothetical protein